ncbi:hypothetical protein GPA10_07695 [Streptomyces sp. p1417]|uniref:Uncharacterized protein n=1 Tax=Streptomyces typhae TaxID=2681492 RepID=A0A6L6WRG1_9ACTN|nr:hypothetical protein [Streptomyces typhae]MVO84653.1 hypothetical protein [Streptomyces typhae]
MTRDVTESLRIFVVPGGMLLTPQQNAGQVCVWCPRSLHPGEGVDLGGSGPWWPHACLSCYEAQTRVLATYLDWADHADGCTLCKAAPPCDTAHTMGTDHIDALCRIAKPALCSDCHRITEPHTFRPHRTVGTSGMRFGYLHHKPCHARRQSGA